MSHLKLPVEEFTTPDPVTANENASVSELTELLRVHGFRHIPIMKAGKVVGIVSDRDLKLVSGFSALEKYLLQAGDFMSRNPVTVCSADSLDQVALLMSKNKIGSVIVNDTADNFLGIFTETDALNALIEISRGQADLE